MTDNDEIKDVEELLQEFETTGDQNSKNGDNE